MSSSSQSEDVAFEISQAKRRSFLIENKSRLLAGAWIAFITASTIFMLIAISSISRQVDDLRSDKNRRDFDTGSKLAKFHDALFGDSADPNSTQPQSSCSIYCMILNLQARMESFLPDIKLTNGSRPLIIRSVVFELVSNYDILYEWILPHTMNLYTGPSPLMGNLDIQYQALPFAGTSGEGNVYYTFYDAHYNVPLNIGSPSVTLNNLVAMTGRSVSVSTEHVFSCTYEFDVVDLVTHIYNFQTSSLFTSNSTISVFYSLVNSSNYALDPSTTPILSSNQITLSLMDVGETPWIRGSDELVFNNTNSTMCPPSGMSCAIGIHVVWTNPTEVPVFAPSGQLGHFSAQCSYLAIATYDNILLP